VAHLRRGLGDLADQDLETTKYWQWIPDRLGNFVYFRPGAEPKRINELTEDDAYLVSCEKFTSFIRFCVDEGKAHYLSKLTTSGLAVSKWKKKSSRMQLLLLRMYRVRAKNDLREVVGMRYSC